jgi:hypothetical protein
VGAMATRELTLVKERKLSDLITAPRGSSVLEASGVVLKGGAYYVIFDNIRGIARIDPSLSPTSKRHGWFGRLRSGEGYEDIAYSPQLRRFFLLVEAEKHRDGTYKGIIDECDEHGAFKARRWVDFTFKKRNTGFEGLFAIRWERRDYLLALCEGNRCKAGKAGRRGGGGRIQVLARKGSGWASVAVIKLPPTLDFEDYSALSLRGDRIAVISQQDSRLWVGTLRRGAWTIAGRGRTYDFPRTKAGKPRYCTLEGLCWVNDRTFAVVSDLSKRSYRAKCDKKDQSIHVFRL